MKKCYMCDAVGDTKEHAPPYSFFPVGYRENLVTVDSCEAHNLHNSTDVEYTRNVITSHHETNDLAREHFQSKVIGSYLHSPSLFAQTFQDSVPCTLDGQESGIIPLDMPRIDKIMEAIAYALYYKNYGKTFMGNWDIYCLSLESPQTFFQGQPYAPLETMRSLARMMPFTDKPVTQPKVFAYGLHERTEDDMVFRFEFYEGFIVLARGKTS